MRAGLAVSILLLVAAVAGCAKPAEDSPAALVPAADGDDAPASPTPTRVGSAAPTPATSPSATNGTVAAPASPVVVSDPLPRAPRVVVAVVDTDLNFYHGDFRRDGLGVAVPGVDIAPIPITLDVADRAKAEEADRAALMAMETGKLYTFPGTKVAAISFGGSGSSDWPLVLNPPGQFSHGTMTASRAVGNDVSILGADPDVDLVFVQGFSPDAVRWAAEQPWIDVISLSSGLSAFGLAPGAATLLDPAGIAALDEASHAKPVFASTGNGVGNGGHLGFPSWLRGASGAPDVISVGANDNANAALWANQDPYVSADGCGNPVAKQVETSGLENTGAGTSAATPYAAGGGAKLILEARRLLGDTATGPRAASSTPGGWDSLAEGDGGVALASGPAGLVAKGPLADGDLTLRELKDVLYHTALATPTDDASDGDACGGASLAFGYGSAVPAGALVGPARFAAFGYGEVNEASIDAAVLALAGASALPARADDDAEYARAHALKAATAG